MVQNHKNCKLVYSAELSEVGYRKYGIKEDFKSMVEKKEKVRGMGLGYCINITLLLTILL